MVGFGVWYGHFFLTALGWGIGKVCIFENPLFSSFLFRFILVFASVLRIQNEREIVCSIGQTEPQRETRIKGYFTPES